MTTFNKQTRNYQLNEKDSIEFPGGNFIWLKKESNKSYSIRDQASFPPNPDINSAMLSPRFSPYYIYDQLN
jgi:hypothetical protein